ncbi:MAG TPA: hypothetical protein VK184_18840 [Nostocaceae cyanobacterium]|nr:hypothetical protein [Nostocaceae cyanobacterium]
MTNLQKAQLIPIEGEGSPFEFMFNPTKLTFSQSVQLNEDSASTEQGVPKVTYGHPDPCSLTISDVIIDTYESGGSVFSKLAPLAQAVRFATGGEGDKKRAPVYLFTWGTKGAYMRCFVTSINWDLTMFRPDGTPVRAKVGLTLKEAGNSVSQPGMSAPSSVDRIAFSRSAILGK